MKCRPLFAAISLFTLSSLAPTHAGPPPWPKAPFSNFAKDKRLDQILREFAGSFNLTLDAATDLPAPVNGSFNTADPTEFIDRLAAVYGFNWFTHAGTLFISPPGDRTTKAIRTGSPIATGQLRQALADLGLLDERFGWGALPDQGVALVSGPPAYVRLIEGAIAVLPAAGDRRQVALFPLKHAAVEDRVISYREREIIVPGVATLLRQLLAGGTSREVSAAPRPPSSSSMPERVESAMPAGMAATPTPSINADRRLNAVVVYDLPERIPMYERLIGALDVPSPLIEIEALIIDVDIRSLEELGVGWHNLVNNGSIAVPDSLGSAYARYFVSRLKLMEARGEARIQARPSILTQDNIGALIDLSSTFYIRATGERVADVRPVTFGTALRVTPRLVSKNGQDLVQLAVDIEDGNIDSETVDNLPIVRKSTVSTQAMVQDGEGLLLGGYDTERRTDSYQKVPGLNRIPILGTLFSATTHDVRRTERLFLIRPKIVAKPNADGTLVWVALRKSFTSSLTDRAEPLFPQKPD